MDLGMMTTLSRGKTFLAKAENSLKVIFNPGNYSKENVAETVGKLITEGEAYLRDQGTRKLMRSAARDRTNAFANDLIWTRSMILILNHKLSVILKAIKEDDIDAAKKARSKASKLLREATKGIPETAVKEVA